MANLGTDLITTKANLRNLIDLVFIELTITNQSAFQWLINQQAISANSK